MSRLMSCLLTKLKLQTKDKGSAVIGRNYSADKKQNPCRIGPKPRNCHDPPDCYEPKRLKTKAFKIPAYIKARTFRPIEKKEVLGPNASKCECYKNPEYFSYHRFSIYDLKLATNEVKACIKCCE